MTMLPSIAAFLAALAVPHTSARFNTARFGDLVCGQLARGELRHENSRAPISLVGTFCASPIALALLDQSAVGGYLSVGKGNAAGVITGTATRRNGQVCLSIQFSSYAHVDACG